MKISELAREMEGKLDDKHSINAQVIQFAINEACKPLVEALERVLQYDGGKTFNTEIKLIINTALNTHKLNHEL